MNKSELRKQLRKTGANEHEADQLTDIAGALSGIKAKGLSDETKQRIFNEIGGKPRVVYPLRWAAGSFAAALVIIAGTALLLRPAPTPTEVNRENDQVETADPLSNQEVIVIEQMQEVEKLKENHAPEEEVKQAETRYEESVKSLYNQNKKKEDNSNYWDWWRKRWESSSRNRNNR